MPEAPVSSLVFGGVPMMWHRALAAGVLVGGHTAPSWYLRPTIHPTPSLLQFWGTKDYGEDWVTPAFWPRCWGENCVYGRERALNLPSLSLAIWGPYSIASGCSGPLSDPFLSLRVSPSLFSSCPCWGSPCPHLVVSPVFLLLCSSLFSFSHLCIP